MYEWPKDWYKLKQDFQRLLHLSIIDYYEPIESAVTGKYSIDIIALDDKLHNLHGDYENRGMSMMDLIESIYGNEAAELVNNLVQI